MVKKIKDLCIRCDVLKMVSWIFVEGAEVCYDGYRSKCDEHLDANSTGMAKLHAYTAADSFCCVFD